MAKEAVLGAGHGRRAAGAGGSTGTRVRWRIAERVISVCVGGAAVSGAIYLGVTGPLVSPVSPAAAQVMTDSGTTAEDAEGVPGSNADTGRDGDESGFDRHRAGDFRGGHR